MDYESNPTHTIPESGEPVLSDAAVDQDLRERRRLLAAYLFENFYPDDEV